MAKPAAATPFDFKAPDYVSVIVERGKRLERIRRGEIDVRLLKLYYRDNPAQFIDDWGWTFDPRNIELGRPALIPFKLFPKQREWVEFLVDRWKSQRPGITEKSRDMGLSWLMTSTACSLCLHYEGMAIGFGSRKEDYVDRLGDPKSLFYKARVFMENLPVEFRGGWDRKKNSPHMRLSFPESGATMTGEAGDNIGRGDRTAIYLVDESAYLEHPEQVDAALSQTTNCRLDVSSVNGMGNTFAIKRHGGKIKVFTFHWRDDPRKDDAWYARQNEDLDPVIVAQEIDIDYQASTQGALIPSAWVQAAVDANKKLKMSATGERFGSLDIADEGKDGNAWCCGIGPLVEDLVEWSGKGSDIYDTVLKAIDLADAAGVKKIRYDADGLGAGARGDARVANEKRHPRPPIVFEAFRGSAAVLDPEREDVKGRKNEDYFANRKAQAWWELRTRFYKTWRAVTKDAIYKADEMIFIDGGMKLRPKLLLELSQPTYELNTSGKIVVDKTPEGARSPNLADAVMIRMARAQRGLQISDELLMKSAMLVGGRRAA